MQKHLLCTLSLFSLCVSDASPGCAEGMQKQMPGPWGGALRAHSVSHAAVVGAGDEGGSDGKWPLSLAGFFPDGGHLLGRQCCFTSSSFSVEKLF